MIALLLVLAVAAIYVGTIETAFSALMRLSLRLMVERGGRDDRLGFYLDDPIQLFVPARLMLGLIFSLATVVLAVLTGSQGFSSIGMLLLFVAVFILLFEHVLPLLIVRRNPEKVLELLLPPFDFAARFLHPLTGTLVRLIGEERMPPVVVAFPDCFTRLGGNQYINSASMGAWEDFLLDEMVPAIEQRLGCGGAGRLLPCRQSRRRPFPTRRP